MHEERRYVRVDEQIHRPVRFGVERVPLAQGVSEHPLRQCGRNLTFRLHGFPLFLCPRERGRGLTPLLPIVEPAGACGKTALPSIWTDDDVGVAFSTASHADRIFSPLDPIHPGPLEGGLDDFSRNNGGGHLLTVHLELRTAHRRLRRTKLIIVQKFGLADAPYREEHSDEGHACE
jgi:hypothetical protein